ncbi:VanZ family protein [Thalassotalea mangrovi]|uniref:VanZ family protein n=1 Tax=Thalassotalea mangrovi TaxID=2572245 RepID=UPI001FE80A50|nr:VanZ family protein [Thalassotalea mangrovi]
MAIFTVAFFGFVLWVIYLANIGQSHILFQWAAATPYGDKLGHLFIFGFLTFIANISLKLKTVSFGRVTIYLGTLLVSIFVLAEEFSQSYFPTRTMDIEDVIADAIGILLFTGISHLVGNRVNRQPILLTEQT